MTTDTEALARRTHQMAEGDVLDDQGFIDPFAEDGVFNGIGDVSGRDSYRGERLGDVRDGKIQEFNCDIGVATMFAQLGVVPDFAPAVPAPAPGQ